MWSNLPFDLLANIFSYLPPDSLARAKATCWNWWNTAASPAVSAVSHRHPSWFVALPAGGWCLSCYVHNPVVGDWHILPLDHATSPIRPIAATCGLILLRVSGTNSLKLAVCNPFTRQFKTLPTLNVARTNPAVGVVERDSTRSFSNLGFKIYVAGGMSEAARAGAVYQPTVEMYDSSLNKWTIIGPMPEEFARRLKVWTPNEGVHSKGTLYWMTSAGAYSVMGFEIATNRWKELSVPMARLLEFAALVPRNGKLAVVGGTWGGDACKIWELGEGDVWGLVESVPRELGDRVLGDMSSWCSVKCIGIDGAICLYRDVGSGVIVWREVFGGDKWEWDWIEGCGSIKGRQVPNFPIKWLLLHPNLATTGMLDWES